MLRCYFLARQFLHGFLGPIDSYIVSIHLLADQNLGKLATPLVGETVKTKESEKKKNENEKLTYHPMQPYKWSARRPAQSAAPRLYKGL